MKNNYLLLVTNKTIVAKLNEESNITFLFPIKNFTVGFPDTFLVDDIDVDGAFIFVNRILDNEGIEKFKLLITNLPENIKGIVFDDIGVLQILNEVPNSLTKILFLNHFNCNYLSVNSYLEYVDSLVVSTDITDSELEEILNKANKPLVVYTFGYINIMYSRRKLLTNYNNYFKKKVPLVSNFTNDLNQEFKMVENEYGTVVYPSMPFNGLKYRKYNNILYCLINTLFLDDSEVINIINSDSDLTEKYPYQYLSLEETIVRIKEREK